MFRYLWKELKRLLLSCGFVENIECNESTITAFDSGVLIARPMADPHI